MIPRLDGASVWAQLMVLSHSGWALFHTAVAAIAVAEIVRKGMTVVPYRRGCLGA